MGACSHDCAVMGTMLSQSAQQWLINGFGNVSARHDITMHSFLFFGNAGFKRVGPGSCMSLRQIGALPEKLLLLLCYYATVPLDRGALSALVSTGKACCCALRQRCLLIVALKSIYPLLSLHCTRISGCACAERWWALLKVCRAGTLT